ncbi:unnamed protein product, partial [Rotaria magnacalcarata]
RSPPSPHSSHPVHSQQSAHPQNFPKHSPQHGPHPQHRQLFPQHLPQH